MSGHPGDVAVVVGPLQEARPLSFVDADRRIGLKTIVVFPDGSLHSGWEEAAGVARAGELPGFGPLSAVYLIVPLRNQAIALRDRARSAGFTDVLYPAGPGELWQPVIANDDHHETG